MAYATVDDVQGHVPTQTWDSNSAAPQPTAAKVQGWLAAKSAWIDASLSWKYVVPVTSADDLLILQQACELLVAADVWDVLGGHNGPGGQEPNGAQSLRRAAYSLLAYDPKQGRSMVVLPNTTLAETGEAEVMLPESTFTDPDLCEDTPRLFRVGMQF